MQAGSGLTLACRCRADPGEDAVIVGDGEDVEQREDLLDEAIGAGVARAARKAAVASDLSAWVVSASPHKARAFASCAA